MCVLCYDPLRHPLFVATPTGTSSSRSMLHPHLLSEMDVKILSSKAHLLIRMLQLRIGHDLLVQVCGCVKTVPGAGVWVCEDRDFIIQIEDMCEENSVLI